MSRTFDKLLILDLDGTLIYASETRLDREEDFKVGDYFVYKRPHLDHFLETCLEWFELAIWTSASPAYAAKVVRNLFDVPPDLAFVFSAERCTKRFDADRREYFEAKRLQKLKRRGYSLSKVLIVDDTPATFSLNYGNGIRVSEYTGSLIDDELLRLLAFLKSLGAVEDVRRVEKRGWRSYTPMTERGGRG